MSLLFLERRPGGRVPSGVEVEGKPEHLRELLAAFATSELDDAELGQR